MEEIARDDIFMVLTGGEDLQARVLFGGDMVGDMYGAIRGVSLGDYRIGARVLQPEEDTHVQLWNNVSYMGNQIPNEIIDNSIEELYINGLLSDDELPIFSDDFDGDEMNVNIPLSTDSIAEINEILRNRDNIPNFSDSRTG